MHNMMWLRCGKLFETVETMGMGRRTTCARLSTYVLGAADSTRACGETPQLIQPLSPTFRARYPHALITPLSLLSHWLSPPSTAPTITATKIIFLKGIS